MSAYALAAALVALAYLSGSIPTGILASKRRGIDIRTRGSGNIGATNVTRVLGRRLGLIVLIIDVAKGAAPVLAVHVLDLGRTVDPFVVSACGVAAIAGHCFPVWLDFRGGKGVATTLGVLLAAAPMLAGLVVAVFALVVLASRLVSLASLCAALAMPVMAWTLSFGDEIATLAIAAALIIIGKHHGNIRRLFTGREAKL
jgi:glycerol-3-phosphate acyltransferase PlsY